MNELWHIIEKFLGVYRWHPKIALRYLPLVETINSSQAEPFSVLEVGSGGLGIAPYLKRTVIGIDMSFVPPVYPSLTPVYGNALKLPFANSSYETVVSMDMLEHVKPADRQRAIDELIRVGKRLVCIGVPCGKLSENQDKQLHELFKQNRKHEFGFLQEHVENGLPNTSEITALLHSAAEKYQKKIHLKTSGNINLRVRKFLMRGWLSENIFANIFFRKILLFAIPVLKRMNKPPFYRTLFIATLTS